MKSENLMRNSVRTALMLIGVVLFAITGNPAQAADNTGTGGSITYTDSSGSNAVAFPPYVGGYVVHTFTNSGTLNIPVEASASVLVVGGGGGGGAVIGGGGGGGGLISSNGFALVGGSNYTVTVGAGGAGGVGGGTGSGWSNGLNGASSVLGPLTAVGGGGGGGWSTVAKGTNTLCTGRTGGSGGGGAQGFNGGSSSNFQGNAGGKSVSPGAGGGGGAGALGNDGTGTASGKGGNGLTNSITGSAVVYAGGGGGGAGNAAATAGAGGIGGGGGGGPKTGIGTGTNGVANTGGGGGGGGYSGTAGYSGGNGGSGIVIVRYLYDSSLDVSVTAPENGRQFLTGSSVTATVTVANGILPYSVALYVNSAVAWSTNNVSTNQFTIGLGALPDGTYTHYAIVTDSAGIPATAFSATNTFTVAPDTAAPTPSPMTFAVAPASLDSPSITMTATTATDALSPPVQYYFENTNNSVNSGWISGTVWTNTGLTSGTTYGYRVKARDAALNETAFSATLAATAAYVQTKVSSSTELAYAADVSTSDLLAGLTATTTGWNLTNGSTTPELNDGIHGVSFATAGNLVQGTWTTVGATAIYNLGLGSSNLGYTLTSIQTIAAWTNAGFGNQAYTVEIKLKGAVSYITLATVNFQPFTSTQGGATKVTLSNPSGVLASGVEFIKFTANSVNGGANAGAYVFRELDVFGTPSEDPTPPTVANLSPADDAIAVPLSINLVATFSKNIARGTGDITIKNLGTSELTVIPVDDSQVSVSNAVLTINPSNNLAASTTYAIHIDATAIKDLANNPFAGISDDTTWNFTSGVPDLTPPNIVTRIPLDNAINVPTPINLLLTFNETIARGTGNITIKNLSDATQTVIPIGDSQIAVSGALLTINPTNDLGVLKNYAIRIDSGAITDISGNLFPGISDDTSWNFTSARTPLRIMCLGDSITVGYTDNPTWSHPFKFGYRSGLYTCLTNAGYNFKLVGGSTEPWTGISGDPTLGGTYTPALDLRDVAQDGHRGYGGASIWSNVNTWLAADTPDVILLLIGINGIGPGSPAALNTLVNSIVTAAPNARLIVAQITPKVSFDQNLYNYNVYIRDTLVPSYVAAGKKVSTVNLYSLFLVNPNDYASAIAPNVLSNGINHPDNTHYDLMAQKWFEGIDALGLGPDNVAPTLVPGAIVDDKGGTPVAANTRVTYTVTFSEDMDTSTVTEADFGNAGTSAITIGTVSEITPGVFTVQVTPTTPGTLRLQVVPGAVVKDVVGNSMVTTPILDDTTLTVYSKGTLILFTL